MDENIKSLAEQLVQAILESGRKIKSPSTDGIATIKIYIFDDGYAGIEDVLNHWKIPINVTLDWDKKESPLPETEGSQGK